MNRFGFAAALAVLGALAGCGTDAEVRMSAREIGGQPDAVLAAATTVLRQDFDRWTIDRTARTITTEPAEYNTRTDSGSSRDLVKARSTMRRTATVIVEPRGPRTLVKVRVEKQRLDTSRREAAEPQSYRLSDAPGYTPIERDSARTQTQNEYWVSAGRDPRIEKFVLDELEREFPVEPAPPPPTSAPTTATSTASHR